MSNYNCKEILQVFGQNIRFAREKRNYTIKDLALKAKYNRIDLSKIEYGEKDIQLSTAIKLAKAIDVPLPDLFSRNYVNLYEQIPEQDRPDFKEDDFLLVFSTNVRTILRSLFRNEVSFYSEIGMDPATVSRILNQRIQDPRISTLEAITKSISKSLPELLSRTSERGNY